VRKWWLVIALVLSLGMNLGILAVEAITHLSPSPPEEAVRPGAPGKLPVLADRLGLKGEARQRFLERQRRFLIDTATPRLRLAEIRKAVRAEIIADHPNRERLDELLREGADTFLLLERMLADLVLETRASLPPEAQRRYVELLSHLKIEGPGAYGRLPKPFWHWFQTGAPPPAGTPPEVLPTEQSPGHPAPASPRPGATAAPPVQPRQQAPPQPQR
jgi:hypothetical protein